MTGRRNRAHAAAKFGKRCLPNWFFPLRPRRSFPQGKSLFDAFTRQIFLHVWLYYGSKNGIQIISNHSKQPQNSVRTSFGCRSICLRKVFACGGRRVVVGADPYKVVQNFRHRILPSPLIFASFKPELFISRHDLQFQTLVLLCNPLIISLPSTDFFA